MNTEAPAYDPEELLQRARTACVAKGLDTTRPHKWPDSRGEYHALCPYHADTRIGSFSFSARGFKCFSCGTSGGLVRLLDTLGDPVESPGARAGGDSGRFWPSEPVPRPARRIASPDGPWWSNRVDLLRDFRPLSELASATYRKRGFSDHTLNRYLLGSGVLPYQKVCPHERLVLPVFKNSRVVGLRGRALLPECYTEVKGKATDESCPKWLQSAASDPGALFNQDKLARAKDKLVIICESPFGAILAEQDTPGLVAVSPCNGVDSWEDSWTGLIQAAQPGHVVIWYDNDRAGEARADVVAGLLYKSGVPTWVFHWPREFPEHYDLADYRRAHNLIFAMHAYCQPIRA